ncbi:MAG: diguanylate cyclase [Nitrospinae bacterium]|nr:diguanylate cyclase [Nitrospinota bacterium]
MVKTAIIGNGQERIWLKALSRIRTVKVIGVASLNRCPEDFQSSEGISEGIKIFTAIDYLDLLGLEGLELVIDLTGNESVSLQLHQRKPPEVVLIDGVCTQVLGDLLEEKSREWEEARGLLDQYRIIYDLSLSLSSKENIGEVMEAIVDHALTVTHSPAGSLAIFDEETGEMRFGAVEGFSPRFSHAYRWRLREGGLTSFILKSKGPLSIPDIRSYPGFDNPVMIEEGIRALAAVPLLVEKEVVGVLYVDDFVPREFSPQELSVLSLLSVHAAVALKKARVIEQSWRMATTDALTGLYNYYYFQERLEDELKRAFHAQKPLSLIFCDLDSFKKFNDRYGHTAGNMALKEVSRIIKECKRRIDIAARYGGEELVLILPDTDDQNAQVVAERIRREIAGFSFDTGRPGGAPITLSIGIASYPQDAQHKQPLIDKADWAMYYAKRKGGNQVRRFNVEKEKFDDFAPKKLLHEELYPNAVLAVIAAADAKDAYTHDHSESVARYASSIARALGLSETQARMVSIAGLLHDGGKIGIPDAILHKKEKLEEEEWKMIRTHPTMGEAILKHIDTLDRVLPIIRHHHEDYEGGGYPDGICQEEIPLEARILRVADAYDAMISPRPYRRLLSQQEAIAELRAGAGKQFDPQVVDAFVRLLEAADKG